MKHSIETRKHEIVKTEQACTGANLKMRHHLYEETHYLDIFQTLEIYLHDTYIIVCRHFVLQIFMQ